MLLRQFTGDPGQFTRDPRKFTRDKLPATRDPRPASIYPRQLDSPDFPWSLLIDRGDGRIYPRQLVSPDFPWSLLIDRGDRRKSKKFSSEGNRNSLHVTGFGSDMPAAMKIFLEYYTESECYLDGTIYVGAGEL